MSYKELYTQWVAVNQAINLGALHETAADQILEDMIDAYAKIHYPEVELESYDVDWVLDEIENEIKETA